MTKYLSYQIGKPSESWDLFLRCSPTAFLQWLERLMSTGGQCCSGTGSNTGTPPKPPGMEKTCSSPCASATLPLVFCHPFPARIHHPPLPHTLPRLSLLDPLIVQLLQDGLAFLYQAALFHCYSASYSLIQGLSHFSSPAF